MRRPFFVFWIMLMIGMFIDYEFLVSKNQYLFGIIFIIFLGILSFLFEKDNMWKNIFILISIGFIFIGGLLFNRDYNRSLPIGKTENLIGEVLDIKNKEEQFESYLIREEKTKVKLILNSYESLELKKNYIVNLKGEIKEIEKNRNPYIFNSKNYYNSNYIHNRVQTSKRDIKIMGIRKRSNIEIIQDKFKETVEKTIENNMLIAEKSIYKSMILGDDKYIEEDTVSSIRDIGLAHILSVSGFHVGVIFSIILLIVNRLIGFHKRIAEFAGIFIGWLYIASIGFPISSIRAMVFISIYILSKVLNRRFDPMHTIGTIGFFFLLYRPLWVLNLSYQLSFIGIILILLSRNTLIGVAKGVFLGFAPINMFYFNNISVISILSNILLIPIISLGFTICFIGVIITDLIEVLSIRLLKLSELMLIVFLRLTEVFDNLNTQIRNRSPSLSEFFIYYIMVLIILEKIDLKRFSKKILSLFIIYSVAVSVWFILIPIEKTTKIKFVDVGQGDCSIIEIDNKNYMIDSGGASYGDYKVGERILLPYLEKNGITNIEKMVISHHHADHMKAFLEIMDRINIGEILIGYVNEENELFMELKEKAKRQNIKITLVESPKAYAIGKEDRFIFIPASDRFKNVENENNSSLLTLLDSKGKKVLFSGDIEAEREQELLNFDVLRNIDLLKVPHHGSKTSSSNEFLDVTSPKVAVIQVGKNNYGHPNKETLEKYEERNSRVYRNDESGLIEINLKENSLEIEEFLKEKNSLYVALNKHIYEIAIVSTEIVIWIFILKRDYKYIRKEIENGL